MDTNNGDVKKMILEDVNMVKSVVSSAEANRDTNNPGIKRRGVTITVHNTEYDKLKIPDAPTSSQITRKVTKIELLPPPSKLKRPSPQGAGRRNAAPGQIMNTSNDVYVAEKKYVFLVLMRKPKEPQAEWVFPSQKVLHTMFDTVRSKVPPHIDILDTMIRASVDPQTKLAEIELNIKNYTFSL